MHIRQRYKGIFGNFVVRVANALKMMLMGKEWKTYALRSWKYLQKDRLYKNTVKVVTKFRRCKNVIIPKSNERKVICSPLRLQLARVDEPFGHFHRLLLSFQILVPKPSKRTNQIQFEV